MKTSLPERSEHVAEKLAAITDIIRELVDDNLAMLDTNGTTSSQKRNWNTWPVVCVNCRNSPSGFAKRKSKRLADRLKVNVIRKGSVSHTNRRFVHDPQLGREWFALQDRQQAPEDG